MNVFMNRYKYTYEYVVYDMYNLLNYQVMFMIYTRIATLFCEITININNIQNQPTTQPNPTR